MLKLYSSVIHCETGMPSFCAGWNLMRCAAWIARSVRPSGRLLMTLTRVTAPLAESTARSLTTPITPFLRASSVKPGSGFAVMTARRVPCPAAGALPAARAGPLPAVLAGAVGRLRRERVGVAVRDGPRVFGDEQRVGLQRSAHRELRLLDLRLAHARRDDLRLRATGRMLARGGRVVALRAAAAAAAGALPVAQRTGALALAQARRALLGPLLLARDVRVVDPPGELVIVARRVRLGRRVREPQLFERVDAADDEEDEHEGRSGRQRHVALREEAPRDLRVGRHRAAREAEGVALELGPR